MGSDRAGTLEIRKYSGNQPRGPATADRLHEHGIRTIRDLQRLSVEELEESALAALRAGQTLVALDRVELAILRGRVELDPVYEALEELVEFAEPGRGGNTELERTELPAPWDEALGENALRR